MSSHCLFAQFWRKNAVLLSFVLQDVAQSTATVELAAIFVAAIIVFLRVIIKLGVMPQIHVQLALAVVPHSDFAALVQTVKNASF